MHALAIYELRYTIMRLARCVLGNIFFVLMCASAIFMTLFGLSTIYWVMDGCAVWRQDQDIFWRIWSSAPPLWGLVCLYLCHIFMACYMSVSSAYRYRTMAPGIPSMICPSCKSKTPTFGRCTVCYVALPTQSHSLLGFVVGKLVTVSNIACDVLGVVFLLI